MDTAALLQSRGILEKPLSGPPPPPQGLGGLLPGGQGCTGQLGDLLWVWTLWMPMCPRHGHLRQEPGRGGPWEVLQTLRCAPEGGGDPGFLPSLSCPGCQVSPVAHAVLPSLVCCCLTTGTMASHSRTEASKTGPK
ncbi:hypothetical protein H1C71_038392 [Ictidomys tridecemlineatus]|nr:hypothetical protein H1C71_038392 [Ictidomys tridecemlineatus]